MTATGWPAPTVEDGWRTIVDGMTIHRWFLAPHRHLERLLRQRWEAVSAGADLPPLDQLRRTWSRGALLQLLHPAQRSAEVLPVLRGAGPPPGAGPLVLAGGRWTAAGEIVLDPGQIAAAPAGPPAAVGRALALLELTGLAQLGRVAIDLVTDAGGPVPYATAWRAGGGVAVVDTTAPSVELTVQLGCCAALQYLSGIHSFYSPPEPGPALVRSPLSGAEIPLADLAAEAVGVGTAHRLLTELTRRQDAAPVAGLLDLDRAALAEQLRSVAEQVRCLAPMVYDLEHRIELTCFETVTVSFPGPRQFEKYEQGYGLGQS